MLVGVSVMAPAVASAATSDAPRIPQKPTAVSVPMHIVGFDAKVAARNGYRIRTAPDGRQYTATDKTPAMTPYNTVEGNCGIAYVYEYAIGSRAIELYTGYGVNDTVVEWWWKVRLNDRGGTSFKPFKGGANSGYWVGDIVVGGLTAGPAQATVVSSSSWVVLSSGGICHAGPATDSTTIY
jgi:hypothetical protein